MSLRLKLAIGLAVTMALLIAVATTYSSILIHLSASPLDAAYGPVQAVLKTLIPGVVLALIICALAAWLLAGLVTQPLQKLTRQLRDLSNRNASSQENPGDEIAQLKQAFTVLIDDLNQRQASLIETAEANRILRVALEKSEEGIVMADTENRATLWNYGAEQMSGWSAAEVLGKTPAELGMQALDEELFKIIQADLRHGKILQVDGIRPKKNGEMIFIGSTVSPLFDAQNNFTGTLTTMRDITALKKIEEALRVSEEKFSKAFHANPDFIMISRLNDGLIIEVNEGFERLSGMPAKEAVGKKTLDFSFWADPLEREDMIAKLEADGLVRDFESEWISSTGERHTVLSSATSFELAGDQHIISSARDITEFKKVQEEIRRLNDELEDRVSERTAELESFSYSVSHDLRAPLRAINGFARVIEEDHSQQIGEDGRNLLERIIRNAVRMSGLIDDLLDFSRVARTPLNLRTIDMAAMVREVLSELQEDEADRDIELQLGVLPAVRADISLMRQVWVNFICNALKYSRGREKTVICIEGEWKAGEAHYSIRDNGAGFDMQYADKLFKVFQRLHSPSSFEGTGIGLAIVSRIITRHHGRVWAEGALEQGATFHFSLPDLLPDGTARVL